MTDLKIGPNGLAVVKAFESCLRPVKGRPGFFKAYLDPVNVWTIGYGHTNHHEPKFDGETVWSQAQCDAALAGDMRVFEDHVNRLARVPLAQHEFDALVSWSFNTGGPATASLWRLLNSGNKAAIPDNLAQWNKAGGRVLNGLTRRRKSEGLLFQGKIKEALAVAGARPSVAKSAGGSVAAGGAAATVAHQVGLGVGWIAAIGVAVAVVAFLVWKLKK